MMGDDVVAALEVRLGHCAVLPVLIAGNGGGLWDQKAPAWTAGGTQAGMATR
jgi:hypothetical protein